MEIWQLNTFSVVAKTLHFTRASQELNLSQSAVSHQIKSLEEELGVQLFVRDKRHVTLTSKGQIVLEYANKMLDQVDVMRREIEETRYALKGELKIVAITRSLENPFPFIREGFRELYKDIELSFESVIDSKTVLEHVKKGVSDIGFSTNTELLLLYHKDLLTIPYGMFEMNFVVGRHHPLSKRDKISLHELENEKWILFEKGSWLRRVSERIFAIHGFKPKHIYDSNEGFIIRSLAENGEGIALLPSWGIVDELKLGNLIPIRLKQVNPCVQLNIIISPVHRSKLVSLFVNYLLKKKVSGIQLLKAA